MNERFSNSKALAFAYTWLFGAIDTATGLGLVLRPDPTLTAMGLDASAYSHALIRFIGAFVFANGSLYLWGAAIARLRVSPEPLRPVWFATAWVRLCVASVTAYLIIEGSLESAWVSVPITDATLAVIQILWLSSPRFPQK